MLVLNAGAQYLNVDQRSAGGFEITVVVNHLAHYLLARRLLPTMAEGGRLVITTSDTHDPAIMPLAPRTLDPQALAHPEKTGGLGAGMRAYAASKLCNLLTARSLDALDQVRDHGITVIAYNPGLTGGTALSRSQPRLAQALSPLMFPLFGLLARFRSQYYMGTPERAGEVLAELASGNVTPPPGRVYVSLVRGEVTFPDPSELARSDDARDRLWRESEGMTGVRT